MAHAALLPALALIAGIALGVFATASVGPAIVCLACALVVSVVALRLDRPRVLVAAVVAGWVSAGVALGARAEASARDPPIRRHLAGAGDGPVTLVGRLSQDASPSSNGVNLSLRAERWTVHGRSESVDDGVALTVVGEPSSALVDAWRAGRQVRVPAWVREPARYRNAGVPDHRLALGRRGVALAGTVKSGTLVDLLGPGSLIDEAAAEVRARVRRLVASTVAVRSPRAGAVVTAILIGDRAGLDPADERLLQDAGTYHVIAISGGNIAILAGCLLLACRVVRLPYRVGLGATAAVLALYAPVAGGGSSVVRATVTAVVYLAGRAIDQRSSAASTLAIAATVILCWSPLALVDPGFLLTFGATAAIVTMVPRVLAAWNGRPGSVVEPAGCVERATRHLTTAVVAMCAASMASEVALLPLGALLFNRVTFAGLALNLLAIPLMSIVQVGGMAVVALDLALPPLGSSVAWVPQLAADWLVESASLVRWAPWAIWRVPAPPAWALVLYYAGLVSWLSRGWWLARLRRRHRMARSMAMVSAVAGAWWVLAAPPVPGCRADSVLTVAMIDVGQGDATAIRLPHGRAVLVDAGGLGGGARFDIGERAVAPALWWLGTRELAALVATHGDVDHAGGAASVATMVPAHEVWEGVPVRDDPELAALIQAAAGSRIPWRTVQAGDLLRADGVVISVVHPAIAEWERRRVRNNDSVVLEVRYGEVSIVLAGDAGTDVEPAIAARLAPARIRVLKVGHHGSSTSTSSAFLAALEPDIALVSCGRHNRFGHPSPVVLRRLFAAGATVFRTDLHGEVLLETNGHQVTVRTFTGEEYRVGRQSASASGPLGAPRPRRGLKDAIERILNGDHARLRVDQQRTHETTK